MNQQYEIADVSSILSPGLVFFEDLIRANIRRCLEMAGGPQRLRPHVKTHKTREIVRMLLEAGIDKHKCATIAEAEMLASAGAPDVLIAYNLVGPNCQRLARLMQAYPGTQFSALVDHPRGIEMLSAAMTASGQKATALLDIDVGQHRTGIAIGPAAIELYRQIAAAPGLQAGGFHIYDGHNRQQNLAERSAAAEAQLAPAFELRKRLEEQGLAVPRMVLGGTPSFPVHARRRERGVECSPGTFVLHDAGYGANFPDLTGFVPAALVLTRVMSRPTATRITFDLGSKAVASDPPAGQRCVLPDIPDCQAVLQSEEHLVVETQYADRFAPGDWTLAVPTHVCPTCALHKSATVVSGGRVAGSWEIVGRDRVLTV
jgi:D-threonine aldolase